MKYNLPHIIFETTSVCNLKCRYCYNIWKMPDVQNFEQFNSYKKAKKTLSKLFKIADVGSVTFTGGEPFTAERFNELVLFTRLKKKAVTIITNGNKAKESEYQQMVDLGVGLFELPIHSHRAAEHDFMTNTPGSWEKSVESVKQLLKMNAYVVAVIVITKANYNIINNTLLFIKSLGIDRIMLNRFNIGGEGIKEKDNLWLDYEEINEAYKTANQMAKENKLKLSSNVCTPLCVLNPDDYKNIGFTTCSPDVAKRPLTIDIDGNLRFCNHSPTILGNIFKDKLEDMFTSETAKKWNEVTPDFCNNCNLYHKCMGGCRAASEQLSLSLKAVDPIVEIIPSELKLN